MATCQRRGACCLGLDWTFNYPRENEDPNNPSSKILNKASEKLKSYGLLYNSFKSSHIKDDKISLTFKVGICQNLGYNQGKAFCKIHDSRPFACRSFFCEYSKQF